MHISNQNLIIPSSHFNLNHAVVGAKQGCLSECKPAIFLSRLAALTINTQNENTVI